MSLTNYILILNESFMIFTFQGITNLRSIDYYPDGSKCYCSEKNIDDVGLGVPGGDTSDSYNLHSTYDDATVYEVIEIASEPVEHEAYWFGVQKPPSTQPYSLLIGEYVDSRGNNNYRS